MPPLGAFTNPLTESPVNCDRVRHRRCSRAMSAICRITASVRSSDAASGSWAKATRYCLSCVGMKPPGPPEDEDRERQQAGVHRESDQPGRTARRSTPPPYRSEPA